MRFFGIGKSNVPESAPVKSLNLWKLRGQLSQLTKTKRGAKFTLTTQKRLRDNEVKMLHHLVQMGPMMAEEWLPDLQEGDLVQVTGEMFYGARPYCLATELEVIC